MAPQPSRARRCPPWHVFFAVCLVVSLLLVLDHLRERSDVSATLFPGLGVPASSEISHAQGPLDSGQPLNQSNDIDEEVDRLSEAANHGLETSTQDPQRESSGENPDHIMSSASEFELFGGYLVKLPRRELVSRSTKSGNFSRIHFAGVDAYNPNLIPHPMKVGWYVLVAQKRASHGEQEEVVCEATFADDVLVCAQRPSILSTTESIKGHCSGKYSMLNQFPGPRDARLAYSPRTPYLVYGSQSQYACLGIWAQDLRAMIDLFHLQPQSDHTWYQQATELWRPEPYQALQKNFFMFWDSQNRTYVQTDAHPKRVLARLDSQGHVVQDLTSLVETRDKECMANYMPVAKMSGSPIDHQSIHQTTNSLAISLCKRADPSCTPNERNTFIMHIIHHKVTYSAHPIYEPYLVLFQNDAPFGLHAIAQKAFWIRGRTPPQMETRLAKNATHKIPMGQSEMFYVTSMSWKGKDQTYHGFIDDTIFLAFGIEDSLAGVIDVPAGDLMQDLAFCT